MLGLPWVPSISGKGLTPDFLFYVRERPKEGEQNSINKNIIDFRNPHIEHRSCSSRKTLSATRVVNTES